MSGVSGLHSPCPYCLKPMLQTNLEMNTMEEAEYCTFCDYTFESVVKAGIAEHYAADERIKSRMASGELVMASHGGHDYYTNWPEHYKDIFGTMTCKGTQTLHDNLAKRSRDVDMFLRGMLKLGFNQDTLRKAVWLVKGYGDGKDVKRLFKDQNVTFEDFAHVICNQKTGKVNGEWPVKMDGMFFAKGVFPAVVKMSKFIQEAEDGMPVIEMVEYLFEIPI